MNWLDRLGALASEVRQSPNPEVLDRTRSLLEELTAAVRAGEAVGPVKQQVAALRAEIERAETIQRRMEAAEAEWAQAVWVALGVEPATGYGGGSGETTITGLRRLSWEG